MKNTLAPGIPRQEPPSHDGAGHEMPGPPGSQGRPSSTVEQMQDVFHELHPNGRNCHCAVCDSQYRSA